MVQNFSASSLGDASLSPPSSYFSRQPTVAAVEQSPSKACRVALKPIWADHRQVTALFALSRSTIYRLTEAGKLKAKKVHGRALWSVEAIEEFIASQPELNARTGAKASDPHK